MSSEKQSPILQYGPPELEIRRESSIVKAICPFNGKLWDLRITARLIGHASKIPGRARELAYIVPHILLNPRKMFKGIRDIDKEVEDDNWLCYCCRPDFAYDHRTGEKRKPWLGKTVAVYVNFERVVYNWFWLEADKSNIHLPIDHANRFGEPYP
jgi:hypothetical protein